MAMTVTYDTVMRLVNLAPFLSIEVELMHNLLIYEVESKVFYAPYEVHPTVYTPCLVLVL